MLDKAEYGDLVERAIARIQYPSRPNGLYAPIQYTLERGGKRLRPTLLLAAADAFGVSPETAMNQALGIEMFHNFTLLHDDLMDNADLRRGCPTVHKKWNPSTAVLSGDTMLSMAYALIADCSKSVLPELFAHFNQTAIEIYEGQQFDMDFESRDDVTIDEYLMMIRLKTSVLLGAACYIGALVALDANGAMTSENLLRATALYNYGIALGLAFQLRDDFLDTFGDPLTFGKEIGGDILNNKKTWLLTAALAEDKSGELLEIVSQPFDGTPAEKIARVKEIYTSLDIPGKCTEKINGFIAAAIENLREAALPNEAHRFFEDLALSTATRIN